MASFPVRYYRCCLVFGLSPTRAVYRSCTTEAAIRSRNFDASDGDLTVEMSKTQTLSKLSWFEHYV
jgi:hypothetical protein